MITKNVDAPQKFPLKGVNKIESSNPQPKQSANSLFHFVKEYDYLDAIIKDKKLPFWYVKENVEYLNLDNVQSLFIPMKCFCDINLHKISSHMEYYGYYGIAFSKSWGIKQGVQPVQYINDNSYLSIQYAESFKAAMNEENSINDEIANYLSTHIMYMKPLLGWQKDILGQNQYKYFLDESEWRYIFDPSNIDECEHIDECEQFYLGNEYSTVKKLNEIISEDLRIGLSFNYSDIKYIIVKTKKDFEKILNLLEMCISDKHELYVLISKIIVWDESGSDF